MRAADRGPSAHDLHAGEPQHALVDGVQALDLAILVREQRLPVEARLCLICPDLPAEAPRDLEVLAEMRGVGEELLRDAADVDAGAAERARLGDGDTRAVGGGDAAGANAARTASYGEEVVVERQRGAAGRKRKPATSGS
jgi:hypothetical protein